MHRLENAAGTRLGSTALNGLLATALVGLVIMLRSSILTLPPYTDEGAYLASAFAIHSMHAGSVPDFAPVSTLAFYPSLLAPWITHAPNPLIAARVVDMLVASLFTLAHFFLLVRIASCCSAFVCAAASAVCLNAPLFINAGFKNPAFLAFLFLTFALTCLIKGWSKNAGGMGYWIGVGMGLGLACAARETFVVYTLPVLATVWYVAGAKPLGAAISGGCLSAGAAVLAVCLSRGGAGTQLGAILDGYHHLGSMYGAMEKVTNTSNQHAMVAGLSLQVLLWELVPLCVVGLAAIMMALRESPATPRSQRALVIGALGLLLAFASLPEFFIKLGFPYHLSYALFGLSIFAAAGLGFFESRYGFAASWRFVAFSIACAGFISWKAHPSFQALVANYRGAHALAVHYRAAMRGRWDDPVVDESFYLSTAREIRRASHPSDSLVVAGWPLVLYPLSGLRIWNPAILDLRVCQMENADFRAKLRGHGPRNLPDIVVETNRYADYAIESVLPGFAQEYRMVSEIPAGKPHYGEFSARIWKLEDAAGR
jgi:hypothetical protein